MSDENNTFENDNQQGGFGQQPEVNRQDNYNQEPVDSGAQGYGNTSYVGQNQQDPYGQPNGNTSYGGQNQQTPLSGYAEPVYHQQYNNYNQEESQGFGIASMICGILALVTCCFWCLCIPLAGIICSAVGLIMTVLLIVFGIVMNSSSGYQNFLHEYNDMLEDLQEDTYMDYQHHL